MPLSLKYLESTVQDYLIYKINHTTPPRWGPSRREFNESTLTRRFRSVSFPGTSTQSFADSERFFVRDRFTPLNYFKRRRHERRNSNSRKVKRLSTRGGIVYVKVRGEKWEEMLKRVNIFDK
jgi:hypothetical protein